MSSTVVDEPNTTNFKAYHASSQFTLLFLLTFGEHDPDADRITDHVSLNPHAQVR